MFSDPFRTILTMVKACAARGYDYLYRTMFNRCRTLLHYFINRTNGNGKELMGMSLPCRGSRVPAEWRVLFTVHLKQHII